MKKIPICIPLGLFLVGACATAFPGETGDDEVGGGPDASPGQQPDASMSSTPDARPPGSPDATRPPPDADVSGTPDAAVPDTPDAAPPPDAPDMPDAMSPPDAALPPDAGESSDVCDLAAAQPACDLCAEAVDLTTAALEPGGATTWGDTTTYADDLEPPSTCTSGYGMDGPDAIYLVLALAGETISVVMMPETFDGGIYIVTDCTNATTCVSGADETVGTGAETLDYTVPTSGAYYIVVDSYLPSVFGCFTLDVSLG